MEIVLNLLNQGNNNQTYSFVLLWIGVILTIISGISLIFYYKYKDKDIKSSDKFYLNNRAKLFAYISIFSFILGFFLITFSFV